jgi:hypothetical protein
MRVNDLTGKTFHRLTVQNRVASKRRGAARWLCRCACGTLREVDGIDLSAGKVMSCGCIRKDDLAGQRFGRLLALRPTGQVRRGRAMWECRCDCGNTTIADISLLRNGHKQSCGCLHNEAIGERSLQHGQARAGRKTPTYLCWSAMRQRCNDKDDPDYGGRGISVCDRWISFEAFLEDMGECPAGLTIERKDTNGNYEPGNCRWATREDQARNRRDTVHLTLDGVTRPLAEWADLLGIKPNTILMRLRRGCSHEDSLTVGRLPRSILDF